MVEDVMKYESGEMGFEEMVYFFQGLIDCGLAWQMQGHYGRTAMALIQQGYCEHRRIFQ
jgi:hypothetical protein